MSKLTEIEAIRIDYDKKINNLQNEIDGLVHERDLKITRIENTCKHKDDNGFLIGCCIYCGKVLSC